MSIEKGDKFLIEEINIAIGPNASPEQVVNFLMKERVIRSEFILGFVAGKQFMRDWPKRLGKDAMNELCRQIGQKLDLRQITVYKHARKAQLAARSK